MIKNCAFTVVYFAAAEELWAWLTLVWRVYDYVCICFSYYKKIDKKCELLYLPNYRRTIFSWFIVWKRWTILCRYFPKNWKWCKGIILHAGLSSIRANQQISSPLTTHEILLIVWNLGVYSDISKNPLIRLSPQLPLYFFEIILMLFSSLCLSLSKTLLPSGFMIEICYAHLCCNFTLKKEQFQKNTLCSCTYDVW